MITDLKPYPAMKDSGVPWLGEVPAHWDIERLKSLMSNIIQQTARRKDTDLYIALEHVESWTGRIQSAEPDVSFDSQVKRFQSGDVLFGKLRPYLAKVARPAGNGVCVGEFFVLRPQDSKATAAYMEQLLRAKPVIDAVNSSTFGAKMPRADWYSLGGMPVTLPPLPEQAAIVRFLDYMDRRIRRYIRAKQTLIKLLEEQKQAIIHRAVTRGLDADVRLKPSGVEWLGEVPAHWEVKRLKVMAQIRYGLGQPPRESETGLPLIRATNVDHGRILEKNLVRVDPEDVPSTRNAFLSEGEIVVVRSGAYTADSAIIPREYAGAVAGYDMVVTPRKARPEFIALALLCTYVRDDQLIIASMRSAQPHLNAEELGVALVMVPPEVEQVRIVDYLTSATRELDAAAETAHREISLLREYRTRLIADVVTGKLDVREVAARLPDEDDEPESLEDDDALIDAEDATSADLDAVSEEAEA
ncbi:MAG TPA: restriction endonuclease subunit S [Actinobacteria bacterium]|nr:restriction endonuclease subunit S [Actinomycetota bacterium]